MLLPHTKVEVDSWSSAVCELLFLFHVDPTLSFNKTKVDELKKKNTHYNVVMKK